MYKISADIGGTFTDMEFLCTETGRIEAVKTLSVPGNPAVGIQNGLAEAMDRFGISISDADYLINGTTIATNAVLEGRLMRCAVLQTEGFRDVLEIGRHVRENLSQINPQRPSTPIPRYDRYEVSERTKFDGTIERKINVDQIRTIADELLKKDVRSVAVCLLHSYVNGENEREIAELLSEYCPEINVSLSCDVSPKIREFERVSTTVVNAQLKPLMSEYLKCLPEDLQIDGGNTTLYMVKSNGGLSSTTVAAEFPATLLLSGPTGGARASEQLAGAYSEKNLVAVDMGGTSFEVSLIHNGKVNSVPEGVIKGRPVRIEMLDIQTIGAGGGSVAKLDRFGNLSVGPESAGAQPGPICYGLGGKDFTVTDAAAILGYIDGDHFFQGKLRLDVQSARQNCASGLADSLGLSVEETAQGVMFVVNKNLANAVKLSLFKSGQDPRDFAMVSYGGAGGLHATEIAKEIGIQKIFFPRFASTFSAHGFLWSDIIHDFSRTLPASLLQDATECISQACKVLSQEAKARLQDENVAEEKQRLEFEVELRYRGQAFELPVPFMINEVGDSDFSEILTNRFHKIHKEKYTFFDLQTPIEVVAVRTKAIGQLGISNASSGESDGFCFVDSGQREVFYENEFFSATVVTIHACCDDSPSNCVLGPTIIETGNTTVMLGEGWKARIQKNGDVVAQYSENSSSIVGDLVETALEAEDSSATQS